MTLDYDPMRIARLTVTTPAARAEEGFPDAPYFEMLVVREDGEQLLMLAESIESVAQFVREMNPPRFNIVAGPADNLALLRATIEAGSVLH